VGIHHGSEFFLALRPGFSEFQELFRKVDEGESRGHKKSKSCVLQNVTMARI